MRFKNCLGMIWSVSTLVRSRGAASEVKVLNGSIRLSPLHVLPSYECLQNDLRWPPQPPSPAKPDAYAHRVPGGLQSCDCSWKRSARRAKECRDSCPGTSSSRAPASQSLLP